MQPDNKTTAFKNAYTSINGKEFIPILKPSREGVEKYIENLNKFVAEEEDDYFTIAATKHKNAFLNEFLQS